MRKSTKALALLMLLSIVLGSFAVFGAFAEETAAEQPTDGRVVAWDMDSLDALTISNKLDSDSLTKLTDEYGQTYWQYKSDVMNNSNPQFFSTMFAGSSSDKSIILQNMNKSEKGSDGMYYPVDKDGDGKYDVDYEKNTDFIVVDFDLSTDTNFIPGVQLHGRFRTDNDSSAIANIVQDKSTYLSLNGGMGYSDTVKVGSYTDPSKNGRKWTNVTIIYDVSAVLDAEGLDAGTATFDSTTEYKGYIYIDGQYMGTAGTNFYRNLANYGAASMKRAKRFESYRVEIAGALAGSTTNFANFTVSKFPVGYNGPLTEAGVLGNADILLDNIADLAYTQTNLPENPTDYKPLKLAEIKRGEEIIPVYSVDDINSDLLDGDVVTLFTQITASFIVTRGEANITWLDKNGTNLEDTAADPAPLFKVPTANIFAADADADWVVIHDDPSLAIQAQGKAEDIYVKSAGVYIDPLYNELHSSKNSFVFIWDDVTTYGAGASGSTVTSGKTPRYYGFKFDLNGHTLTVAPSKHYIAPQHAAGRGGTVNIFKNGTLNFGRLDDPTTADVNEAITPGGNLLMMGSTLGGAVKNTALFENLNLNIYGGTFIDQRMGDVTYRNCKINSSKMLSSLKSSFGLLASLTVDNCEVNLTGEALALIKNVSNKYGSFNCDVVIKNSDIVSRSHLITYQAYPNSSGTDDASLKNDNTSQVSIVGGSVKTTNATADLFVVTLSGYSTTEYPISFTGDFNIAGAKINANNVLLTEAEITEEKIANVDIELGISEGTRLTLLEGSKPAGIYGAASSNAGANISLYLANGVKLNSPKLVWREDATPAWDSVRYESVASRIAYTSLGGDYDCVVTPAYDTCTYKLGNTDAVEFLWNKAEGEQVDVSKLVTLKVQPGVYSYKWTNEGTAYAATIVPEFKLSAKSNLTLFDYLYYNVFINKAEYDALASYIKVTDAEGNAIEREAETFFIDEVEYYKFQAKNVNPALADSTAIKVAIEIPGAYDDKYVTGNEFTVLQYAERALAKPENDESEALINALLKYVSLAAERAGRIATSEAAAALISADAIFEAINTDDKMIGTLEGVSVAIKYDTKLNLGISATSEKTVRVTYTLDGNEVSNTYTIPAGGEIFIAIKAYDFMNAVTVECEGEGATLNIQGYYWALEEMGAEAADLDMVTAIYNYAKTAAAYKATKAN